MAAATVTRVNGATAIIASASGGDFTVDRFDGLVKVDTTVTSTATLPDARLVGNMRVTIVRTVGILTVLTVQGQLSQTINGAATLIIPTTLFSAWTFISDGANWIAAAGV